MGVFSRDSRKWTRYDGQAAVTRLKLLLVILTFLSSALLLVSIISSFFIREVYTYAESARCWLSAYKVALGAFKEDIGRYPTQTEGLDSLVSCPDDVTTASWRGPYLEKVPTDPWRNPYRYLYPGKSHPETFDLASAGPDGKFDTADDISSLNN